MGSKAIIATMLGLSTVSLSLGLIQAQEPKAAATPTGSTPAPKPSEEPTRKAG